MRKHLQMKNRKRPGKACRMAGLDNEHVAEEDFINVPVMTFNPHLAIGKGYRMLSWVWYSTMGKELGDGKSMIASVFWHILDVTRS